MNEVVKIIPEINREETKGTEISRFG
jgi:hypothetical protein